MRILQGLVCISALILLTSVAEASDMAAAPWSAKVFCLNDQAQQKEYIQFNGSTAEEAESALTRFLANGNKDDLGVTWTGCEKAAIHISTTEHIELLLQQ
jgi:hypothetical protein